MCTVAHVPVQCVYQDHRISSGFEGEKNSWSLKAWKTDCCQLLTHELSRGSERALKKPPQTAHTLMDQISQLMQAVQFHLIWPHVSAVLSLTITLLFLYVDFHILSPSRESRVSTLRPIKHHDTQSFYGFDKHILLTGELNARLVADIL